MIKIKELMTCSLVTLNEHDSLRRARRMMVEKRIRHAPVVDDENRFIGLITQRDLLAVSVSRLAEVDEQDMERLEEGITVGEVMNRHVIAVDADTELLEAGRYLLEHKFGCLPVLHDGHLEGILTESDFVKLVVNMLDTEDEDED